MMVNKIIEVNQRTIRLWKEDDEMKDKIYEFKTKKLNRKV